MANLLGKFLIIFNFFLLLSISFSVPNSTDNFNLIEWLDEHSGYVQIDDVRFPEEFLEDSKNPKNRGAFRDERLRWPGGVVVYYLDSAFDYLERGVITRGLNEISSRTCIRFKPWAVDDKDYVFVRGDATGCWSYHGRQGGGQVLNLGPGCINHRTVVHEFVHTLGFIHEHSRPDRDDYIRIDWSNVRRGTEHNFEKFSTDQVDTLGVPYDYESIMHYSRTSFATDPQKDVITPTTTTTTTGRGEVDSICGEAWQCPQHLSHYDVIKVNRLYENLCGSTPQWRVWLKIFPKLPKQTPQFLTKLTRRGVMKLNSTVVCDSSNRRQSRFCKAVLKGLTKF